MTPALTRPGARRGATAGLALALALILAMFSMGPALAAAPASAPSAPLQVSATQSGSDQVTVSWATPASDGGSAIKQYIVGWDADKDGDVQFVTPEKRSFVLTDLAPGHYTFWVEAENDVVASAPSSVTLTVTGTTPTLAVSKTLRTASSTVVLSGIWAAGDRIFVQRALPGGSYSTIATIASDNTNNFTRTITVVNTASYRVETSGGFRSPALKVAVANKVSLSASRKGVRTYQLAGRVYPAVSRQVVRLYVARSGGYSSLKTVRTTSTGYFKYKHKYSSKRTYTFKAVSAATTRNSSGAVALKVAVH